MTRVAVAQAPVLRAGRVRLAGVAVLVAWAALIAASPQWIDRLRADYFDLYQVLEPRRIESMPVTIVEIDERSLATFGRWPWPRARLARLVDTIDRNHPAAVGLDVLMPEPDPLSPERILDRVRDELPGRYADLAALPSNDTLLSRSLSAAPAVLAIAGTPDATGRSLRVAPISVVQRATSSGGSAGTAGPPALPLLHFGGALTSIELIDGAASGWGLISVDVAGGGVRRIPLVASIGGTLVPSFAIEMLRVAQHAPSLRLVAAASGAQGIRVGRIFVPTESDGAARVYFSHSDAGRFVSAVDVLDGKVDAARVQDRLVLIGVTGIGLGDFRVTPLRDLMSGTEIQAQLLENIIDGTLLSRPRWASAAEACVYALFGALLLWAVPRWTPRTAAALALACIALMLVAGDLVFRSQRLLLDGLAPSVGLLLLFGVLLLSTLTEATRQRRALERMMQLQREQAARLAGELEAGRRIQTAMLPDAVLFCSDPRMNLSVSMTPAREVGGDLYDFYRLDDRRLFFMVGDVAGKGLSASIFMAVSRALYKSSTLRLSGSGPGELMSTANAEVSRDNPEMLFVTAFAAVLDLDTGDLAYCNAGHENPYRLQSGETTLRRIEDGGGPPLCAVDGYVYTGAQCRLRPGELLCVISDGVTEAQNRQGALFGQARLREILLAAQVSGDGPDSLIAALRAGVETFVGGAEPADDVTILVLRWNGPQRC